MKSAEISAFLRERIEARDFPSAVYLIAEKGEIVFNDALGFAVVEPEKIAATVDTIYDLASLTKPLVAGLLAAKLLETGDVNLTDAIATYFAEFGTEEKRDITIENLLTHTSGFAAWLPFYAIADARFQIPGVIAAQPLACKPKKCVVYSDLNFLTLTFLLEKIHGETIDEIARREIFAPLRLEKTFYNPPFDLQKQIAASENGNLFERQMSAENGFTAEKKSREQLIWGAVHDGNAAFMAGVSGHAGLFSNAFETFKIARQFLAEETVLLEPETCELFRANRTLGLNEARSIAFQLAATTDSTASLALSSDSFGHLGFTGTSLWIEPQKRRIFILLTNRTHARASPFANINRARRRFHELASNALDSR